MPRSPGQKCGLDNKREPNGHIECKSGSSGNYCIKKFRETGTEYSQDKKVGWSWLCSSSTKCYNGNGADYVGDVSTATYTDGNGKTHDVECQKWKDNSPHEHNYPGAGPHNFCRNPDNESRPWCYTTDKNRRWAFCNVKKC